MNAARQAFWLFLVLIGLATSGWYFASNKPHIKFDKDALSIMSDTTMTDLTVRQFDAQGQLANVMTSPEMTHIPANNIHWFKSPRILIAQANQAPWHIRADMAKSLEGGEELIFIKNVVIHQDVSEKNQESTLTTEKLNYYPKKKMAHTPLAVRFEQGGSVVNSIGMNAWLEEKRVQLLGHANGVYQPKTETKPDV